MFILWEDKMNYSNGDCPETDELMYRFIDGNLKTISKKPKMTNKMLAEYNMLKHRYEICKKDFQAITPETSMSVGDAEEITDEYEFHKAKFERLLLKLWENGFISIKGEHYDR